MEYDPASIIPPPPPGRIETLEDYFEVTFPDDYKQFAATHNGAVPLKNRFDIEGLERVIERFLPILQDVEDHPLGWLDLEVVASQLDARLTDDEDGENINLIPIAALLAGDFVVLDYRKGLESPTVGFWNHEASEDFAPAVTTVARTFNEFLSILR
jgi:cell wall assembly regulator SMI1